MRLNTKEILESLGDRDRDEIMRDILPRLRERGVLEVDFRDYENICYEVSLKANVRGYLFDFFIEIDDDGLAIEVYVPYYNIRVGWNMECVEFLSAFSVAEESKIMTPEESVRREALKFLFGSDGKLIKIWDDDNGYNFYRCYKTEKYTYLLFIP